MFLYLSLIFWNTEKVDNFDQILVEIKSCRIATDPHLSPMSAYKKEQLDICLEGKEGEGDFFIKKSLINRWIFGIVVTFSPDGSVPLFYEKESAKFFLPAAKPSGPRTVRVVGVGGGRDWDPTPKRS